jgi:hypothetical protein
MPKCSARKRSRAALDSRAVSVPWISRRPSEGAMRPAKRLRNVDFPEPDGPTRSWRGEAPLRWPRKAARARRRPSRDSRALPWARRRGVVGRPPRQGAQPPAARGGRASRKPRGNSRRRRTRARGASAGTVPGQPAERRSGKQAERRRARRGLRARGRRTARPAAPAPGAPGIERRGDASGGACRSPSSPGYYNMGHNNGRHPAPRVVGRRAALACRARAACGL